MDIEEDGKQLRILLVEDDREDAELTRGLLADAPWHGFECECVGDLAAAVARLASDDISIVLLDLSLPDCRGLETLARIQIRVPGVPIIVITGLDDEKSAIEAVHRGAQDYLVKSRLDSERLVRSIRYALERSGTQAALQRYRDHLEVLVEARTTELRNANRVLQLEIAERKHAEHESEELRNELLEARELEAIGRLAGGVAHEFNNALMPVIGHGQLMLDQLDAGDPFREHVTEIVRAAGRLTALTRKLLAFSRTQLLQREAMDLNVYVEKVAVVVENLLGDQIELVVAPHDGSVCVSADTGQMQQLFVNLAMNARDAMPDGGRFTIRTANVVLDENDCGADGRPGRFARLSFEDTGTGMDGRTLELAFQPFFTTKEFGPSSGLGLSVVHGIAKQHEGWVGVSSKAGGGTVFNVYLPAVSGGNE